MTIYYCSDCLLTITGRGQPGLRLHQLNLSTTGEKAPLSKHTDRSHTARLCPDFATTSLIYYLQQRKQKLLQPAVTKDAFLYFHTLYVYIYAVPSAPSPAIPTPSYRPNPK